MTTLNTKDQIIELTDDQLEAAQGGCGHQPLDQIVDNIINPIVDYLKDEFQRRTAWVDPGYSVILAKCGVFFHPPGHGTPLQP